VERGSGFEASQGLDAVAHGTPYLFGGHVDVAEADHDKAYTGSGKDDRAA